MEFSNGNVVYLKTDRTGKAMVVVENVNGCANVRLLVFVSSYQASELTNINPKPADFVSMANITLRRLGHTNTCFDQSTTSRSATARISCDWRGQLSTNNMAFERL